MNQYINQISEPTLLIDAAKVRQNLRKVALKAQRSNTLLRPHVKTIHLPAVAELFRPFGIDRITVSNPDMGLLFAWVGWKNILLAFPLSPRKKMIYKELIEMLPEGNMHFILESPEMALWLDEIHPKTKSVWIKLDTGQHRTGIQASDTSAIRTLYEQIKKLPGLRFQGLLAHFGQLYGIVDPKEKKTAIDTATESMLLARNALLQDIPVLLSAGDTPSASMLEDFRPFDEFRAGNFVYYDVMQWSFGNCSLEEIAVSVVCPVVSHHVKRGQSVIHGGAIHFAKDFIHYPENALCFGLVIQQDESDGKIDIAGSLISVS